MDPSDEKAAARYDGMDDVPESSSPETLAEDPENQPPSDPEKDLAPLRSPPLRSPRVPWTGTDRDKHLSVESAADKYKRESVETGCPRCSTISTQTEQTEQTDPEGVFIDPIIEDIDVHDERHPRFLTPPPGSVDLPRPENPRGLTGASATTIGGASRRSLPSLRRKETKLAQKEAHPWQHLGITLGLPMILLFDLVVPCIIYYVWYINVGRRWRRTCDRDYPNQDCPTPRPQYNSEILGYAIISFGFGEIWILGARVHRLFFHRDDCAPLLSRNRWELDATSWVYGVAVLMALIPFVIGAELDIPHLYLYSPAFIMVFLLILMIITLIPIPTPIGINSASKGTRLRPFIYYAAEDFIAVDGLQDREFRVRYNDRYETNRMFRHFFIYLTLWWMFGIIVYVGCLSAVIWNCEFHIAFGLSLGVLFSYIIVWAVTTAIWVDWEMKREHRAYEAEDIEP